MSVSPPAALSFRHLRGRGGRGSAAGLLLVHQVQVELGAQEARVRILLHEAKYPPLGQVEAGPRDVLKVLLCVLPGVRVQVHLEKGNKKEKNRWVTFQSSGTRRTHSETPQRADSMSLTCF